MLYKKGFSGVSRVHLLNKDEIKNELASPEIVARLEKHAKTVQALAPKSDDFLYFSIIFLKAAESATIDENGNPRKVGADKAWGYFDENWKWHGNVKGHKNNNNDIFPSSELKKAARKWIGKPLCIDHKSDSVDGVRGIILDAHFDEKRQQVVGLCALDKVNYPDLARKVSTGVVRFGSMGTAVEKAICYDCGHPASSPADYCEHIKKRSSWGEINIGLNPLEYSLVVQPAEPGAILLRCIASLEDKKDQIKAYAGVENVDDVIKKLSAEQANLLDMVLEKVCEGDSCSLDQKKVVVSNILSMKTFTKKASLEEVHLLADTLAKIESTVLDEDTKKQLSAEAMKAYNSDKPDFKDQLSVTDESLTSGQNPEVPAQTILGPDSNTLESATRADTSMSAGVDEPKIDTFNETGIDLNQGAEVNTTLANIENNLEKFSLKSITEEIMKEASTKRALERRNKAKAKLAYHQGGTDGKSVEPTGTYKSEDQKKYWNSDKHMHQTKSMGGKDGVFPGDESEKEKLKRAELEAELKKESYYQGGTDGKSVEPSGTYKTEDYKKYWNADKHMHQTKSMGGKDSVFPGDEKIKTHQKRAAYNGPALKTRLKTAKRLDGTINKAASAFEVYAGDKLIIGTTAAKIWGPKLDEKWDYFASKEYGKDVTAAIREHGVGAVASVLCKSAQEDPMAMSPAAQQVDTGPAGDFGAPPAADVGTADALTQQDFGAPEETASEDSDAASEIETTLSEMEEGISSIRENVGDLATGDVDVNVNVGGGDESGADKLALSKQIIRGLKEALANAENSADELALLAETHEKIATLPASARSQLAKLSTAALSDARKILGEIGVLTKLASVVKDDLAKTADVSEYVEDATVAAPVENDVQDLVVQAKALRKSRREQLLKEAQELVQNLADDSCATDDKKESEAKDHEVKDEKKESDAKDSHAEEKAKEKEKENDAKDKEMDDKKENCVDDAEKKDDDYVKSALTKSYQEKKNADAAEAYKAKVRRAYELATQMQKKGFLQNNSRAAFNTQVDRILDFDDTAFEAFKQTIDSAQSINKAASLAPDLGGLNIGVEETEANVKIASTEDLKKKLDRLFERSKPRRF